MLKYSYFQVLMKSWNLNFMCVCIYIYVYPWAYTELNTNVYTYNSTFMDSKQAIILYIIKIW